MAQKAPGKSHRKGLTVKQLFRSFPDDSAAEKWFEKQRWPDGRVCTDCGSSNTSEVKNRNPMPYRCRDCRHHFSVSKGTAMQSTKLGLQNWAIALYMMTTGLKGVSSMKVYRELGITQKTAWFMMQRIREGFMGESEVMAGPVEADETYMGGKRKNMKKAKREQLKGRGPIGKQAVVGVKDRKTKQVSAKVVSNVSAPTLQGFVAEHVQPGATVYTDDALAYDGLKGFNHKSVCHSVGEYVNGQAHTNGVESLWSMLKRGYIGTYHKMSFKHLCRYVKEFAGRQNIREFGTADQMRFLAQGLVGKRLRYKDLVA